MVGHCSLISFNFFSVSCSAIYDWLDHLKIEYWMFQNIEYVNQVSSVNQVCQWIEEWINRVHYSIDYILEN